MSDLSATGDTPLLSIRSVSKRFGAMAALDDLSLDVGRGEFIALLGPSGCGKTTLMRLVAGFERAESGSILLDGVDIADVPPHRRSVNMMFQSYALFPHMNVERNIAFGLEREGMKRADIRARVDEMLTLAQIADLRARRPDQLSGGQRQRVALARALAKRPRLLLLDEPLAALDRKLREETQFELMHVQRALGTSFVLVTHDQDEAMVMADRIAVMRAGRIEQLGPGRQVYDRPANRWVAGFVGEINLFEATALDDAPAGVAGALRLKAGGATVTLASDKPLRRGQDVAIAVRPERMSIAPAGDGATGLAGEIVDLAFRGDTYIVRVRLPSGFVARVAMPNAGGGGGGGFSRGDRVALRIAPGAGVALTS